MTQWPTYRSVILDKPAELFVTRSSKIAPRFDDQWSGVEVLLARIPEQGTPRNSNRPCQDLIFVYAAHKIAKTRELWVLYSYDQNQVIVHAAKFK